MARPTDYNEEILTKTMQYLEDCKDTITEGKLTVKLPTIEGLAYFLKVNRDTIYEWCRVHPEFSDIIDDLRAKQADSLINSGLAGTYNSTIAKVLLAKHGYRDAIDSDITTGGKPIRELSPKELAEIDGILTNNQDNA